MWLSVRSRNLLTISLQMLLVPHAPPVGGRGSPYYTYETLVPELVSWVVFEENVRVKCAEGLQMETAVVSTVTSDRISVNFFFAYDAKPGVFGMLSSMASVLDATSLRVFNVTRSGGSFITQEDQCVDEEVIHTTAETGSIFVIGDATPSDTGMKCFIKYNNGVLRQ